MKKITNYFATLTLLIAMSLNAAFAQNTFPSSGSAGIGTSAPNSSAVLELKSTSKGMLVPRMTKAQRDAINSPATGLLIYQTNNNDGFYYYSGSSWEEVKSSGANKTLSNLKSPTAVNVDLLPSAGNTINVGSSASSWKDLYLNGDLFVDGSRVLSFPSYANSFIGGLAGNNAVTGVENTAAGFTALSLNTTGNYNTATGSYALGLNTIGEHNTANGRAALYNNTSGHQNTAIGSYSMYLNTSGADNTAVGISSLYWNSTGRYNTAIGHTALQWNTDAYYNTAIGTGSGYSFTFGWNNTLIGAETNANGAGYYNTIALGHAATVTGVNQARIGNSSVTSIGGYANWTNISDGRYKKNVREDVKGIDFINKLRPVTYNLDVTGISKRLNEDRGKESNAQLKIAVTEKEKTVYSGFIAQEVEEAANELGYNFSGVDKPKNDNDLYGLRYAEFVVPLVKAVQELSKQNENLQKQIDELNSKLILTEVAVYAKEAITLDKAASLEQNSPNPFNQQTTIRYSIPADYHSAALQISDMNGSVIKIHSINQSGYGELIINAGDLESGVYQNTLIVDGRKIDTKQMILAR